MKNFFILLSFLTFFVSDIFSQTIQLGTGTATNGTTTSSPVNIWYRRTVAQFVYTAAELNAVGISGPCDLQDLGWFVTQSPVYNPPGYTVKVKHVTANNISAALGTTGWTTIKGPFTYNPTAGGWDMLSLDNTFSWNGTDNIGVEVCWSQVSPSYSSSGQCRIYSTSNGYRYSWTDASGNSCGSTPNTMTSNKPQVQMIWSCAPPCTTPAPPSVSGATINCGDPATLTASGSTGNYQWFSDANGNNSIGTGNSISLGNLFADSTVYVAAASGSAATSGQLGTTQAGGNGCGGGNMFDITTNSALNLTGFTVTPNTTGTQNVVIYYKAGSYNGFQTNQGAWTNAGTYTINGTNGSPTLINLNTPISLNGNSTYGIYVQYSAQYTTGANTYSNADITITTGMGHCSPFDGCCSPRTFNGIVHYQIGSAGCLSNLVPVTVTVNGPTPPTANGITINCGDPATLTASGSTGNYEWFSDANGSNSIGTGNSISLGNLYADSIVYVAATSGSQAGPPVVIYNEDWQGGNGGWTLGNSGPYWNRISGGTGSVGTGPNGGSNNGTPTNGNFYVYLETSTVAGTAYLTGPGFTITGAATLEFDYHMYGSAMGTLAVEVFDGTSWMQVWSLSGQQQSSNAVSWATVFIPLTNYTGNINIRFSGLRGSSFTSDMAVDNISISETQTPPPCFSSLIPVTAITDCSALPVTLISFTTECNNGIPLLKWSTASEQNSDYFLIERSRDGYEWIEVSKITASGNSSTIKNYQFYDMASGYFEGYYRLKQVDFDGQFEYFDPKFSNCVEENLELIFEVFPNPTKNTINFRVYRGHSLTYKVHIKSALGTLVLETILKAEDKVDISLLESGVYYFTATDDNNHSITKKIVKQ